MGYVLSLDLGTTALKLLLLSETGETAYACVLPYETDFPRPDYMQQRPAEWERALREGMRALLERYKPGDILAVGFSGHMSSVVLIGRDKEAVYPCITLADGRSAAQAAWLDENMRDAILEATGNLPLNAFALPKLLWLRQEAPEAFEKAECWISAKDYLRLLLTGETGQDVTDAGNSLCVSLNTRRWNEVLIKEAGLPISMFPPLMEPYDIAGRVTAQAARLTGLLEGTPVCAGGADMACGAVTMGMTSPGDASVSLGTNAPFMMITDRIDPAYSASITYHPGPLSGRTYALGTHFNGGLAVNCFSRLFTEDSRIDYDIIGALAREAEALPPGSGGVLTLPFLAGSSSPYFDPSDRGTVIGVSTATTRAQLLRSALEGVALNLRQSLELMRSLCGRRMPEISLFGGGAKIPLWPRIISEVFGLPLRVVANPHASAVGGALLAGHGVGLFPSVEKAAEACLGSGITIEPGREAIKAYDALYARYLTLYEAVRPLYEEGKHV